MEFEIAIAVFVFLFGITFGSFYNVVIYRLPLEMSIARGRSMCFSCKHPLGVWDLFPLFSYVFLGGKCRYCKAKISIRYFLIELLTGLFFLLAYVHFGLTLKMLLMLVFWSMLLIVAMIDLDTMWVYDSVLLICSGMGIGLLLLDKGWGIKVHLLGALLGFAFYYTIYFVAKLLYKQEAFGYGDVLLNASIGLILGYPMIILSSMLSFFVGFFGILLSMLGGKKVGKRQEIPFGPYMCMAAFITSIWGEQILAYYYRWMFLV